MQPMNFLNCGDQTMFMTIVRGNDRRTQAYAQIVACHELGLAYLGSIFFVSGK